MTKQQVKDAIAVLLTVPVTLVSKLIDAYNLVLDFITESTVVDIVPLWTIGATFNTDGTGDGQYCKHEDDDGNIRIFETKTDSNTGNAPPTDPEVTENTHWKEISPSSGSAIKEWAAGTYGEGLIIVYHNHSTFGRGLCILLEATRPFTSANIETEITSGKWAYIAISKQYVDDQILSNINGIRWKASVKARTTAALAANTVGGSNTTLTANANGAFPNQDGIAIALNDDILVANEGTQSKNGIYRLTDAGSAGTPWVLTRRGDSDSELELQNAVVNVDQGTVHANTTWRQDTDSIVLGTSAIVWNAFNITVSDATEGVKGIAELASSTEAETTGEAVEGNRDHTRIITARTFRNAFLKLISLGLASFESYNNSYSGGSSTASVYDGSEVADGATFFIEVFVVATQTSGTAGATGYTFKLTGAFRKSGGVLTQIGSSAQTNVHNDTGDSFTGTPSLSVTGGAVVVNQNLTTAKTFNLKFKRNVY